MLDPFPFPPPPLLSLICAKLSTYTHLNTLPAHIHEFLFAFFLYHFICLYGSPFISKLIFPRTYSKLSHKTKLNWDVHVVSLVQSCLINGLAIWTIWYDEERGSMDSKARIWGYTGAGGFLQAMAGGYFLWDVWVSIAHLDIFGWGLLAHAVSALWVFSLGYRPFVNYYGPIFILYELSSPFLNFHWFFDKLNLTGSTLQLVNGVVLMVTFFGSRLVWGTYWTFRAFDDIFYAMDYQKSTTGQAWLRAPIAPSNAISMGKSGQAAREMWRFPPQEVPMWLAGSYLSANSVLICLNVYWFGKMIQTIRSRFPPPFGTKTEEDEKRDVPDKKEVEVGRGAAVGVKSVDVKQKEVRHRTVKGKIGDLPPPPPQ